MLDKRKLKAFALNYSSYLNHNMIIYNVALKTLIWVVSTSKPRILFLKYLWGCSVEFTSYDTNSNSIGATGEASIE
jgi:hypothetical protein